MKEIRLTNLERLIRESFGNNVSTFAKKIELSISYTSELKNGKKTFTEKTARKLEKKLGLIDGYFDSSTPFTLEQTISVPLYSVKLSAGDGCEMLPSEELGTVQYSMEDMKTFGVSKASDLIALRAEGDSMSPLINDGAKVIINTGQKEIIDNRHYAFYTDDCVARVKTLRKAIKGIVIISENPSYSEEIITENDNINITIIGEVVGWYNLPFYKK